MEGLEGKIERLTKEAVGLREENAGLKVSYFKRQFRSSDGIEEF